MEKLKLSLFEKVFYLLAAVVWCVCFSTLIEPEVQQLLKYLTA